MKNKKYQKGKGKTILEKINDNGILNKDYPDISYSKEGRSALNILNSSSHNNYSILTVKGGKTRRLRRKSLNGNKSKSYKKSKFYKKSESRN